MSFFEELKRRNVIRVAVAYGIAVWFILQLTDLVLENIGAPGWVMQSIMLVLGIGFPLAIIFAWAFEMTPEGLKKEKNVDRSHSITSQTARKLDRVIIGVLTIAVAYLMIDKLVLQDPPSAPAEATQTAVAEPQAPVETGPSVAVLPFINMSGDQENEYFSDGLTETLLHMLAQIPDLRVAARTSSFAFKGQNKSIGEIAATLGVKHVLEGSVQKSGDRVRVTAQLVRADDGFHVWSQNYTRPLVDIFAIQDEIATDVANALDASLLGTTLPNMKGVATTELNAYDDYLKGLEQQAIFSYGSLNIAEDYFRQALAHDPDFTDARLALIRNYLLKNGTGVIDNDELRAITEPLIAQIRAQDPDNRLARAFELLMGLSEINAGSDREQVNSMITELRNMLPLIPGESLVRARVAEVLNFFLNQERDAIEVLEAGLLFDPQKSELHRVLGNIQRDSNQLDDALASLQHAQGLAPDDPNIYSSLADLEKKRNNLFAAMKWERRAIEVDPQDHELVAQLAQELYYLGLPEEGDRWFARVNALVPGSAIAQMVELNRAVAKEDNEHALNLARSMIINQVDERRGAFYEAIRTYTDLMMEADKSREAYDFLISTRPETANYDALPGDFRGILMQWFGILLLGDFESPGTQRQAWNKMTANLDARGGPWRDPQNGGLVFDLVITGQHEEAVEHLLKDRLSQPMATNLRRHERRFKSLFGQVYFDPRVTTRLTELDREYAQLREDVGLLMLEPEWNP
jgi:TolB-like protein/tetratricopeptide (TPR) repeat protein